MHDVDLIVVGAGVVGIFHAYHAARVGLRTLLIERNAFPNDASVRNFGILSQSLVAVGDDLAVFADTTLATYRAIQQQHDITIGTTGSLYLASTEAERRVLAEFARTHAAAFECRYFDADEALRLYPFVRTSYCTGALLFPCDLTLDPRRMLRQLLPYVQQSGLVEYLPLTTVVNVERAGERCAVTDAARNRYLADRVIVCSGSEYRTLFPHLFMASGLRLCKLQMMQTVTQPLGTLPHALLSGLSIQRYPAFFDCPSFGQLQSQPVDEEIQRHGIHLLLKQASDGSVIVGDSHEYRDLHDAGPLEETTNCAINEAILRYARTMITLPSWELQGLWNGYYLVHPERPIYTETIDERIHVVTGIGGKGMTLGAGFARAHIASLFG